jgi:HK97 family phage major capsid protein/HK97 family phage prohead protease
MQKLEFKAALSVSDAGEITGLAWPFGTPDRVGDLIEKGAFNTPARVPMLFAHDQAQPIGVWESLTETAEGLQVKGRLLVEDVARAKEVRALVREGAVTGLSIGFVTKAATNRRGGGRTITALDLHEISIVSIPAHPDAQITSVKSITKETSMDPEEIENAPTVEDRVTALETDVAEIKTSIGNVEKAAQRIETKMARPGAANDNRAAANDNANVEKKAFGSYLRRGVERMDPIEAKALTVGTDANGGYLAPDEFGNELIKLLVEQSPVRQYAKVITISSAEIKYPRRLTSTGATWVGETDDRTESGMTFEQVNLTPHELATFTDISTQLLEDNAYGLEGELLADYAEQFGKTEALAFVKGTGIGQPKGIMAATGIKEVKTGVAAAFPTANPADVIIGMYHSLPTTHAQNGVWMLNRNTLSIIRQWKDTTGRYLVLDPISDTGTMTLLGRPIVEALDMDDIGAGKFPILFGDLSGYRIVDRVGLSTLRDPYTLATKGQVRFHARKRTGADLTHPDQFVKLKVSA